MTMQSLRKLRIIIVAVCFVLLNASCSNFLNTDDGQDNLDNSEQITLSQVDDVAIVKPNIVFSDRAINHFNQGNAFLLETSNLKAIEAFNKAIAIEPKMEAAYYNLMRLDYAKFVKTLSLDSNTEQLEELLSRAKTADVVSARMLTLLGMAKRQLGEFTAAEKYYERALVKDANYLPLLANMAILQDIYLGKLNKALAYYQQYESQLSIQGKQDKRVKNWLSDIKRRIEKSTKEKS